MAEKITPRAKDYPQWYLDVVKQAGLADNSDVRGCMVIKPNGYAIWENMQRGLDRMFKETGHVNAYFPLFIPMSYLAKEEEMAEGFAKECAVVTHYRLKSEKGQPLKVDPTAELEEPLIVRPTSETIIWRTYKSWIQSYRDLPLLINQWANVVRWEMRTRLFLRTAEFLWQEGHTAHSTAAEAEAETLQMVKVYAKFAEEFMAVPVLVGPKTDGQKFPGAIYTLCIEAMMQDGKALQAGTSHFLGQNFAKAFDVMFTTADNKKEYAWATSWGASTRLVGGLIMAHSDDSGLVVPPRLAATHVAICPLGKTEAERAPALAAAQKLAGELRALPREEFFGYEPIGVQIDNDLKASPGYRFAKHEVRGVPLRVEVGPRDMEKEIPTCMIARRDFLYRAELEPEQNHQKKTEEPLATAAGLIVRALKDMQRILYERAKKYRDARTVTANTLEEFAAFFPVKGGDKDDEETDLNKLKFVYAHWDGTRETEDMVQKTYKATIRCLPFDGPMDAGICPFTGRPSARMVVFARAY